MDDSGYGLRFGRQETSLVPRNYSRQLKSRAVATIGLQQLRLFNQRDVLAQCPSCKTIETLQFAGDKMAVSRKFTQKDGKVYHDCGSHKPCHLHGPSAG
jgi:hypothetical protein